MIFLSLEAVMLSWVSNCMVKAGDTDEVWEVKECIRKDLHLWRQRGRGAEECCGADVPCKCKTRTVTDPSEWPYHTAACGTACMATIGLCCLHTRFHRGFFWCVSWCLVRTVGELRARLGASTILDTSLLLQWGKTISQDCLEVKEWQKWFLLHFGIDANFLAWFSYPLGTKWTCHTISVSFLERVGPMT